MDRIVQKCIDFKCQKSENVLNCHDSCLYESAEIVIIKLLLEKKAAVKESGMLQENDFQQSTDGSTL